MEVQPVPTLQIYPTCSQGTEISSFWRLVSYPLSSKQPLHGPKLVCGSGELKEAPLLPSLCAQLLPTDQDREQAIAESALGGRGANWRVAPHPHNSE